MAFIRVKIKYLKLTPGAYSKIESTDILNTWQMKLKAKKTVTFSAEITILIIVRWATC